LLGSAAAAAGGDVFRGVEDDVLGSDAVGGVAGGGGRYGLGALQAFDTAALVHAHQVGYLVLDLGAGVHGGLAAGETQA
jgi:hypothetical protein